MFQCLKFKVRYSKNNIELETLNFKQSELKKWIDYCYVKSLFMKTVNNKIL